MREEIFQYVKKKYKVEPDYPFSTAPTYPVLRHKDIIRCCGIRITGSGLP